MIFAISCKQKDTYDFQIVNETDFHIDEFEFDDEIFEINPYDQSPVFTRTLLYNCVCISEPLVEIRIKTFSDSVNTFENSIGNVFAPANRSTSEINIFRITLSDSLEFPNYVFDIEYEP
jgi:hypothetical protein